MTSARPLRALDDPPGGVLFWLIVGLELVAFAIVLGLVAALRRADPVGFHEVHVALDPRLGLALTALLFGSGWAVAEAVHAFRHDAIARARRAYVLGLVLGLGFVVLKVWDFVHKVQAGHGLGASDAWDAYLLATGFHFAWNATMGYVFGIPVSGGIVPVHWLRTEPTDLVWSGGSYGLEAGFACTLVMSAASAAMYVYLRRSAPRPSKARTQ